MKKDKFQITMPELQKIIKEEYASMAKDAARTEEINSRLGEINEELETLPETLSEVEASGTKKTQSTGWSGDGGDTKYGEKFEKIGTHLKEDDEIEGEMEMGGEEETVMGDDMGSEEMGSEEMGPEMGYFEMKFAELGKELDAKISGDESEEAAPEMEMGMGEMNMNEMEETKHESIEGESVNPEALKEETVEEGEEVVEEVVEEDAVEEGAEVVEEGVEIVAEEAVEEAVEEGEEVVEEMEATKLEPIEGESPIQDSDARFNDYMEKDNHIKEGANKVNSTLLSEGFTPERKSAIDRELDRMKRLAKI